MYSPATGNEAGDAGAGLSLPNRLGLHRCYLVTLPSNPTGYLFPSPVCALTASLHLRDGGGGLKTLELPPVGLRAPCSSDPQRTASRANERSRSRSGRLASIGGRWLAGKLRCECGNEYDEPLPRLPVHLGGGWAGRASAAPASSQEVRSPTRRHVHASVTLPNRWPVPVPASAFPRAKLLHAS